MGAHHFVQALFALAGVLAVAAALCNWNWFFTAQNAQCIVRNVGRRKARLFYGLLGLLMLGMAVYFFLETRTTLPQS